MQIILFDNPSARSLWPICRTKAVAQVLFGMLTNEQRWHHLTHLPVAIQPANYLQPLYTPIPASGRQCWIDANVIPDAELWKAIATLPPNACLVDAQGWVAGWYSEAAFLEKGVPTAVHGKPVLVNKPLHRLTAPWQIFAQNAAQQVADFQLLTAGRQSAALPEGNTLLGKSNFFAEENITLFAATINATTGPVYLSANTTIMEGSCIRGGLFLGNNSVLKMGSKIYGATTLGPSCMGGGEIKNVVMQGHSNKAHEGYLGDSVIGEWCNFGAGTSNSNLKNSGGMVHMYSYEHQHMVPVAQKGGLIMGDYTRVAINSCINTGSVFGICGNVFGAGLLPNYVPDFTWGTQPASYTLEKALIDISNWMQMKNKQLTQAQTLVLKHIFAETVTQNAVSLE